MNHSEDEKISDLLKRWDVPDSVPGTFRASVWSQIATRQERRDTRLSWRVMRVVTEFFASRTHAIGSAAVALVLSIAMAHIHADTVSNDRQEAAQAEYLASISPLARIELNRSLQLMQRHE